MSCETYTIWASAVYMSFDPILAPFSTLINYYFPTIPSPESIFPNYFLRIFFPD